MDKLAVMHVRGRRKQTAQMSRISGIKRAMAIVLPPCLSESLRLLQFVAIDQPSKPAIASGCCRTNAFANFAIDGVANNRNSQKTARESTHPGYTRHLRNALAANSNESPGRKGKITTPVSMKTIAKGWRRSRAETVNDGNQMLINMHDEVEQQLGHLVNSFNELQLIIRIDVKIS